MGEKGLAIVQSVEVEKLFKEAVESCYTVESIDPLIEKIEKEVRSIIPDTETAKGRDQIKSLAAEVSRTKVRITKAGEELTKEWREKTKVVNTAKNKVEDRLSALRDEARQPLTDYENAKRERLERERLEAEKKAEEERIAAEEKAAAEKLADDIETSHDLAITENKLFDMEKKEAIRVENERIENEKREAEDEERRVEQERKDEELRQAQEEKAQAEREKEEAIERVQEEKAQAQREKNERIEAELLRKKEEKERIKAQEEQDEKDRLAETARVEREKIAAGKKHRQQIHNQICTDLEGHGLELEVAESVVDMLSTGKISHVTINY